MLKGRKCIAIRVEIGFFFTLLHYFVNINSIFMMYRVALNATHICNPPPYKPHENGDKCMNAHTSTSCRMATSPRFVCVSKGTNYCGLFPRYVPNGAPDAVSRLVVYARCCQSREPIPPQGFALF